jgi:hypothetical protein
MLFVNRCDADQAIETYDNGTQILTAVGAIEVGAHRRAPDRCIIPGSPRLRPRFRTATNVAALTQI